VAAFGPDFRRARRGWLYESAGGPGVIAAIAIAAAMFLVVAFLQTVFGVLIYLWLYGPADLTPDGFNLDPSAFAKSTIVGMLPSGLLATLVAWFVARRWKTGDGGLPLHLPQFGWGGWSSIAVGFAVAVYVLFIGTFWALGIDPQYYAPTSGGISDENSSAGLVEKVLADLADEPMLFAIAIPGVTVAVPIAEELIFRGPAFAALVRSPLGRWGAVLISSAAWAMVHLTAPWLFIAVIFMMGLILGTMLLRFGSLWVTILCHCLWNALSTSLIFGAQHLPGAQ
jgi:membrane protease YdiL (CAAX protease family)